MEGGTYPTKMPITGFSYYQQVIQDLADKCTVDGELYQEELEVILDRVRIDIEAEVKRKG